MKTYIKNLFTRRGGASCAAWVLPALIAGLGLIPAGRVTAQTFTTLYSFTGGSDGGNPYVGLIEQSVKQQQSEPNAVQAGQTES